MPALLTKSLGDTVQTKTRKVDPARKFKCTTAALVPSLFLFFVLLLFVKMNALIVLCFAASSFAAPQLPAGLTAAACPNYPYCDAR